MAKFNLADEIDILSYDFRPYVESFGEIAEPTTKQIDEFRKALSEVFPVKRDANDEPILNAKGEPTIDTDALKAMVAALPEGDKIEDLLYAAVSELCSGEPSVDVIRRLPFRGQRRFIGWITGAFLADPQLAPATNV